MGNLNVSAAQVVLWAGYLLTAGLVGKLVISALKGTEAYEDVNAGEINKWLSFALALVGFGLDYWGFGGTISNAATAAVTVFAAVFSQPAIMLLAWLIHQIYKAAQGQLSKGASSPN